MVEYTKWGIWVSREFKSNLNRSLCCKVTFCVWQYGFDSDWPAGPGMRNQHEQASFSLPYVEIYLSRSKIPRKFVFRKGVAELVLCGGKTVFLFLNQNPGDAAACPPVPAGQLRRPYPCSSTFVISPMSTNWTILIEALLCASLR